MAVLVKLRSQVCVDSVSGPAHLTKITLVDTMRIEAFAAISM
jgi:hypothetical protein